MTEPPAVDIEALLREQREAPYVARIERGGFGWWIEFTKGLASIERETGWWALTEAQAERKAKRIIARWTARDQRAHYSRRTLA